MTDPRPCLFPGLAPREGGAFGLGEGRRQAPRTPACIKRQGAIVSGKRLSGNPNAYGQLGFPNITQAKLEEWTAAEIAEMLTTGLTADGNRVGGPMVEVVRSTSQLSAEDRAAMAEYIKSVPPIASDGAS